MQQHQSQPMIPQAYHQPQRNASNSPHQRVVPPLPLTPTHSQPKQYYDQGDKDNHYSADMRLQNRQSSDLPNGQSYQNMTVRLQALERENQSLKKQLEKANNQIQILSQKLNQHPTQSLLKTTTFELVVLQKAVEQLESLKSLLAKKLQGSNNQTALPESFKDVASEFKSKVTLVEDRANQSVQQSQAKLLFPKEHLIQNYQSHPPCIEEAKEEPRQGRRILANTQSDQVEDRIKISPIKYLNVKACGNQMSLRISPKGRSEISQH